MRKANSPSRSLIASFCDFFCCFVSMSDRTIVIFALGPGRPSEVKPVLLMKERLAIKKRTKPCPEINEHHFAAQLFPFERSRVDPRIAVFQFRRLLTHEDIVRMLRRSNAGRNQEYENHSS